MISGIFLRTSFLWFGITVMIKKWVFFLVAASLFLQGAFAASSNQAFMNAHDNESVDVSAEYHLIPQAEQAEDSLYYSAFDIHYPQITGKKLSVAMEHFNALSKQIVKEKLQQFKNSLKRDLPHMKTLPESVRHNNFHIDYDIDVIHPGNHSIISVRFSIEGMQAGRAHPFHQHRVLNFDVGQNKVLKLSDLFQPHTNYLGAIAAYSIKKLNEPLKINKDNMPKEIIQMREGMIKEGAAPRPDNYKNWNIQSDSLLITFDEYQVAPYSDGALEVEIPFSALKSVLSLHTALAPCLKNPKHCTESKAN